MNKRKKWRTNRLLTHLDVAGEAQQREVDGDVQGAADGRREVGLVEALVRAVGHEAALQVWRGAIDARGSKRVRFYYNEF